MIISHRYKFIFVKTVKTAGTSIEVFLSQHCGPSDIVTPIDPHVEPHVARNHQGYYNHMPAFEIRRRLTPEIWNSYFKFTVERNPWDKTLSYYHMENYRRGGGLGFGGFLAERRFPLNFPFYTEPSDPSRIIVNQIVRYEHLASDLSRVFQQVGIPFYGTLGVNAKSEYRADRRPYREIYSPAQAKLVENIFQHEIGLHGYLY